MRGSCQKEDHKGRCHFFFYLLGGEHFLLGEGRNNGECHVTPRACLHTIQSSENMPVSFVIL